MKDELLAEEYVKEEIPLDTTESGEKLYTEYDLKQAFLAGLKAGRPQWHDLRKDPNDLPKDTTSLYLVRVYSWDFGLSHLYKKYGMYIPTVCEWSGEHFKALNDMAYSNARNIKSCIAWCEIPTFDMEGKTRYVGLHSCGAKLKSYYKDGKELVDYKGKTYEVGCETCDNHDADSCCSCGLDMESYSLNTSSDAFSTDKE